MRCSNNNISPILNFGLAGGDVTLPSLPYQGFVIQYPDKVLFTIYICTMQYCAYFIISLIFKLSRAYLISNKNGLNSDKLRFTYNFLLKIS